ncbi:unnamed protein product [Dovyalis caffra]|uniref:DNA-(apurinic or apyrimidinic site) endonuclease 2 n=1 Tax=Dovyalis caffra TaxID=77055 RepID=A0AAV1RGF2_9ROSI|nr:unnamed protein product [Dovyalis caffra]
MENTIKIVTYNVNGLRQRVSQFGSLSKLLNTFDADIICFQETKLRRQELTSDLVIADGYESFFLARELMIKAVLGVATFCRVKSAFTSTEVALPVAAEEGFTGFADGCKRKEGLEEFEEVELVKVDGEGRCVITDHDHFVLFNLYGPRAAGDDTERIEFKMKFFKILQKRWENLLHEGRRVFVVGDLNIAPTVMDRCDADPDFEKNEFRRWFRSMLMQSGGIFVDVFRAKHPDRREAYTCWSSSTGAEQFNFGSRIDHILCAGPCLHQEHDLQGHSFLSCHVKECDILTEYKRWKPGDTTRWKGGWGIKLEGSDHAPVYMSLEEIHDIPKHSTPPLSARYLPMIHGVQQTLVTLLMKRQAATQVPSYRISSSSSDGDASGRACSQSIKSSFNDCSIFCPSTSVSCSLTEDLDGAISKTDANSKDLTNENQDRPDNTMILQSQHSKLVHAEGTQKKARKSRCSQLSLRSFFQKSPNLSTVAENSTDTSPSQAEPNSSYHSNDFHALDDKSSSPKHCELNPSTGSQDQDEGSDGLLEREKNNVALLEWQRIQQLMQNSIPVCKGHKEPCVARIVKKPGPTFGCRFFVCSRAESLIQSKGILHFRSSAIALAEDVLHRLVVSCEIGALCSEEKADQGGSAVGICIASVVILALVVLVFVSICKCSSTTLGNLSSNNQQNPTTSNSCSREPNTQAHQELVALPVSVFGEQTLPSTSNSALPQPSSSESSSPFAFSYGNCAICLDDYAHGESIRVLPSLLKNLQLKQYTTTIDSPNVVADVTGSFTLFPFSNGRIHYNQDAITMLCLIVLLLVKCFFPDDENKDNSAKSPDCDEIAALPTFSVGSNSLPLCSSASLEHESSAICFDEYIHGGYIKVLARGKHMFHRDCIDKWLLLYSLACPVCRDQALEQNKEAYNDELGIDRFW